MSYYEMYPKKTSDNIIGRGIDFVKVIFVEWYKIQNFENFRPANLAGHGLEKLND